MKRSHTEDEWFAKHERDLIADLKRERQRREQRITEALQKEQAAKLKALHWRRCPECGSEMKEEPVYQKVLIERCTLCGGLFFDRGELEDILLSSDEDRKSFRLGVLHMFFPQWKSQQPEGEKIIADYKKDEQSRKQLLDERLADPEMKKIQELHYMNCPKCGAKLTVVELPHGLVIDECTLCNGIFLHYGELDAIRALSPEERKTVRTKILERGIS